MDPTLIEYVGFFVAALILGWAVVELNKRYFRQRRVDSKPLNTWVKLDSTSADDIGEPLPEEEGDEDEENIPQSNIQIRAQQNGHHSVSKKLLCYFELSSCAIWLLHIFDFLKEVFLTRL